MKRLLYLCVIVLLFLSLCPISFAQTKDYRAGIITVERRIETLRGAPILSSGYYKETYAGNFADAFFVNYTGIGFNLLNLQANGVPVLTLTKSGDLIVASNLSIGNADSFSGLFAGFTAAESKTVNIIGLLGNNPVIRKILIYISNDPGGDTNVLCRLSFYSSDSFTESGLIFDCYFNATYTETNGGASVGDTTDTVDTTSGLVKYDMIRYLGGTAENGRITAVPTATGLTFTALVYDHADNTGVVRVVEVSGLLQLFDADVSKEVHAKLEFLSAPPGSTDVTIEVQTQ